MPVVAVVDPDGWPDSVSMNMFSSVYREKRRDDGSRRPFLGGTPRRGLLGATSMQGFVCEFVRLPMMISVGDPHPC